MAKTNQPCAAWVNDLLEIQGNDSVLEVGFGPGVGIQLLAESAKYVAGIDPSPEMLKQARVRNAHAIDRGRVDLRIGSAEHLPFEENTSISFASAKPATVSLSTNPLAVAPNSE
jgi:ubiquinone/menaquinone biosynthesis C-methylase UbiE